MKKSILTILLLLAIVIPSFNTALAQNDKINIKGEVKAINGDVLTVETKKGAIYDITIPADLELSGIEIGDSVLVKATAGENGKWLAKLVKEVGSGNGSNENEIEIEDPEGFQEHAAYCSDEKKAEAHPLAPIIAERYGVSEDFVMAYYCDGYSIGAIMLALRTSQLGEEVASPDDLLISRASGNGWGQIWKELGLIGSEKEGHSPPGQLKKQD